jgi:hypothetical protein
LKDKKTYNIKIVSTGKTCGNKQLFKNIFESLYEMKNIFSDNERCADEIKKRKEVTA